MGVGTWMHETHQWKSTDIKARHCAEGGLREGESIQFLGWLHRAESFEILLETFVSIIKIMTDNADKK